MSNCNCNFPLSASWRLKLQFYIPYSWLQELYLPYSVFILNTWYIFDYCVQVADVIK